MLGDEISNDVISVGFRIGKLSAKAVLKGLEKLIDELEKTKDTPQPGKKAPEEKPEKQGKQTRRKLEKQNGNTTPIELTSPNLRLLNREMKRAKIAFAVEKDGKGKYTLYFKGRDVDKMTRAFKRYTQKAIKQTNNKPSISKTLTAAKKVAQDLDTGRDKEKNRSKGAIDR